jgi:hypothetical protein
MICSAEAIISLTAESKNCKRGKQGTGNYLLNFYKHNIKTFADGAK